jgi:hypothetical protein
MKWVSVPATCDAEVTPKPQKEKKEKKEKKK